MLFNSIEFAFFFPVVFIIYWFIFNRSTKLQNVFLLVSSYIFYGWWDWRFLLLLAFSTLVDYTIGLLMSTKITPTNRKILLYTSIIINIGLLGFLKYYNFFIESFVEAFSLFGNTLEQSSLKIILPVGISFYTLQSLSYSIDVYRKRIEPTKDIIAFFAFISFFPQLVAGPIERASNLLPQFFHKRTFNYSQAADGMRLILWGLFKKIVIADNCAELVNDIFRFYYLYPSSTIIVGVILFAFQIYGDFSGYSDMAIGLGKLLGFNLIRNFAYPYLSKNVAEFWRRWHISLTSWFKDYIYIPLGGNTGRKWFYIRNIFIVFLLSGFWHGANLTYIAWGLISAIFYFIYVLFKEITFSIGNSSNRLFNPLQLICNIIFTFSLIGFSWIFFRAESINSALKMLNHLFVNSIFILPTYFPKKIIFSILILLFLEFLQQKKEHVLEIGSLKTLHRWLIYIVVSILILYNSASYKDIPFIYFQF